MALGIPGEVVASEQEFVFVQQHHMSAGMAGSGDDEQVAVEFKWCFARDHAFHAEAPRAIVFMHDAGCVEFSSVFLVIGNVIAMRQENSGDAAGGSDSADQWT